MVRYRAASLDALLAAAGDDDAAAVRRIAAASPPRRLTRDVRQAQTRLDQLVALGAPDVLLRGAQMRADPLALLHAQLDAGEPISEPLCRAVCRVSSTPVGAIFDAWWVTDPARRRPPAFDPAARLETLALPWPDSAARRHLFGASRLPDEGDGGGWHRGETLAAAAAFIDDALAHPPPDVAEFAFCYPHLHPMRFALDEDATRPGAGPLAWEYAAYVHRVHSLLVKVAKLFRTCARRGDAVGIFAET